MRIARDLIFTLTFVCLLIMVWHLTLLGRAFTTGDPYTLAPCLEQLFQVVAWLMGTVCLGLISAGLNRVVRETAHCDQPLARFPSERQDPDGAMRRVRAWRQSQGQSLPGFVDTRCLDLLATPVHPCDGCSRDEVCQDCTEPTGPRPRA